MGNTNPLESLAAFAICFFAGALTTAGLGAYISRLKRNARNDAWERPLNEFISDGRSEKCDRIAMAIGADADEAVLGKFFEGTTHPLLYAENAKQLRECFKYITMSVTMRTKSQTPNIVPEASAIDITPTTIEARPEKLKSVMQKSSDNDGGYW